MKNIHELLDLRDTKSEEERCVLMDNIVLAFGIPAKLLPKPWPRAGNYDWRWQTKDKAT